MNKAIRNKLTWSMVTLAVQTVTTQTQIAVLSIYMEITLQPMIT